MATAAQRLAELVAGLRFGELPAEAVRAAKRHLIDALGVALAAADTGAGAQVVLTVRSWAGAREATVLGHDFRAPAAWAALANGTLAHALDFDDTHMESIVHPSAFVLPAALAVAQETGAGGRDLLVAAIAGYEVATRIGAAAPGRFHPRGLHPTGLCGPFGAAVAAGKLWELSETELARALGIAGSQSSGLFAYVSDGSETKRLHAGWAAHAGVVAADLARRGFTGPLSIFEGPNGFFDGFIAGERPDLDRLVRGLGSEWEVTRIAIKPYPCCHFLHAAMDAAAGSGVAPEHVDRVECAIPPATVGIVAEPRGPRLAPATTYAAQFSLPFAVASAMTGGREALDLFGQEARSDRAVLGLAERVWHIPDDTLPFPRAYGARVRIETRGGREIVLEELTNRGHPDRPLSDEELAGKFLANAGRRLEPPAAEKLLEAMWRLEELDSVEELADLAQVP